ncbi:MAG: cation diffusion facilitator family transporter [Bacteroidales bacterium]|nr:cation diffusion facilitator family transporter [Bacteroidales bacterium]
MKDRERTIARVTLWGAFFNLLLTLLKMLAGIFGRSSAMVADAVHSLSDLVSDLVVVVMIRISSKERDHGHDYGHGKFETLATVFVSVILLAVAGKLMADGVGKIMTVARGGVLESPGRIALWAALVSIAVKEILYQWTAAVGRKVDSPAMIANAWHHRSDALSSVGSALGIGGALLLGGRWTVLDPVMACVISIVIIVVAVKMMIPALAELTDASLPDEIENRIIEVIQSVPGVENAHNLRTRRSGPDIIADVHIVVNPEISVRDAHEISSGVESALKREFGGDIQVSIHIEPDIDSE